MTLICAVLAGNASQFIFPSPEAEWPRFPEETKLVAHAPDAELRDMLSQIDPARVKQIITKLVSFGTRHTLSTQDDPNRGIGAARDWIASEMRTFAKKSSGKMTVTVPGYTQQVASRITFPVQISNVVARLEGSVDPSRVYVISGHYDSMNSDIINHEDDAPGANDDASGVAVVMELARIMSDKKPHATILFAAVAGEEQGLYGSAFMARTLKSEGVNVEAMLNNDIVGSSTGAKDQKEPYVIRMFAQGLPTTLSSAQTQQILRIGGENDSPTRQLARFIQDVATNDATGMNVQIVYRLDRYGRGGDHSSFLQQGYPAVRFTEPNENFAHQHQTVRKQGNLQYGDLPEFCDFNFISRVAKVNMAALWSLANSPGLVPIVKLNTAGMINDSNLSWNAVKSSDVAGYEIVWRQTLSSYWTNVKAVGNALSTTMSISPDNVIFGVRAVGKNGYRGPVTPAGHPSYPYFKQG
ncbi:putative zinc metalloprotease [Microthyrium microscopicum]|uniref:Peptide hydrolase n=1 Tax=Microthyrium microscopicum TaxID=703497 RepID=A0A6A6UAQ1_9PEZI|nr:putative zinc metalloprotease [Microthyrium microscopicum]